MDIYEDIAKRTGGNMVIGVVGPMRTGKSTFVKKFAEEFMLSSVTDDAPREAIISSVPAVGDMTKVPVSVPKDSVRLDMGDSVSANVQIIDAVGYMVDGVDIDETNDQTILDVCQNNTFDTMHNIANIGIVVMADESIVGVNRDAYAVAEDAVMQCMKDAQKPFIILLNTKEPNAKKTKELKDALATKYGSFVIATNIDKMTRADIDNIMAKLRLSFPITSIEIDVPSFIEGLSLDNNIISDMTAKILNATTHMVTMADADQFVLDDLDAIESIDNVDIDYSTGVITYSVKPKDSLFYEVISEEANVDIKNDCDLVTYIKRLKQAEEVYNLVGKAMFDANDLGYGVVTPSLESIEVGEPTLVKKGNKAEVRMNIKGTSIHIMKVDIDSSICPAMGNAEQCNDMIDYINNEAKKGSLLDVTLFNKPIGRLIEDEIDSRLSEVTPDTKTKVAKTMGRIVNEGRGGVLCILI